LALVAPGGVRAGIAIDPPFALSAPTDSPGTGVFGIAVAGNSSNDFVFVWADAVSHRLIGADVDMSTPTSPVVRYPRGLPLVSLPPAADPPAIVSSGQYIVFSNTLDGSALFGASFPALGAAEAATLITSGDAGAIRHPAVAADGSGHCLAAWTTTPAAGAFASVLAVRVDMSTTTTVSPTIINITDSATGGPPSVAFDPSGDWWVAWEAAGGSTPVIDAARVGFDGGLLNTIPVSPSAGIAPHVTAGTGQAMVAWNGAAAIPATEMGALVSAIGSVGVFDVSPDSSANPTAVVQGAAVTASVGVYAVIWVDTATGPPFLYGAVVSPGVPAASSASDFLFPAAQPALAFDGAQLTAAWSDPSSGFAPRAAALQPSSATLLGSQIPLLDLVNHQDDIQVASDGTGFLAVWLDDREGYTEVRGALIDARGDAGSDFLITGAPYSTDGTLAVAGSDGGYLVLFQASVSYGASPQMSFRRLQTDGTFIDSTDQVLNSGTAAAATWNGSQFVVATQQGLGITVQQVELSGSPWGDVTLATSSVAGSAPAVATLGNRTLAVWLDAQHNLEGTLVLVDGGVSGSPVLLVANDGGTLPSFLALAAGTSAWTVGWGDVTHNEVGLETIGISSAGLPVPLASPDLLSPQSGETVTEISMVHTPGDPVVAWSVEYPDGGGALHALRFDVLKNGPADPVPATLYADLRSAPGSQPFGGAAADTAGDVLLAFTAVAPHSGGGVADSGVPRAMAALIDAGPLLVAGTDGGRGDAGAGADGGGVDAGGVSDGGTPSLAARLGCSAGPFGAWATALIAAGVLLLRRRR
jgi:hypothetical protein